MTKFTDYIFDIVQNSLASNASNITIKIIKKKNLKFIVKDNGYGMSKDELKRITSPFYTTRTTRKIGLGLSLIILLTEQTSGSYDIKSVKNHGTKVTFEFDNKHLDFPPEGNYGTLIADISSHQHINHLSFIYIHHHKRFKWRYKDQSRQLIIKEINQYIDRGGL